VSAIPGAACLIALIKPGHAVDGYDSPRLAVFMAGAALVLLSLALGTLWWQLAGRNLAREERSGSRRGA
jgi:hypothetical protein